MHAVDAGSFPDGKDAAHFRCGICGHDTGWIYASRTEVRRGKPCPCCNVAAQAAPETGRRPDEAATRPVLDAPAAATAGVSAPRGRPSRRSAIRPRGARGRKPETKSP